MENQTVFCSTKRFEGDDAVKTKLTLDMSNVTETDLVAYAVDALVIKWQSAIRRKKDVKVPTEATYMVPKPGTRSAATMTPFDALLLICGNNKDMALGIVNKAGSVEKALELFQGVLADYEASDVDAEDTEDKE